ncbi:hypothetical protein ACFIQF_14365 [Comamonas sp. J-3]|uniref:hypothetical protein n=1 Tax=Comamonas trifloxystrobinivorans TaxID=3350256 RepID=UPI00372689FD
MTDPSREAFEKWMRSAENYKEGMLERSGDQYVYTHMEATYIGYMRGRYDQQAAMAHKEADAWQPIETAPKDKTILLGYANSHGHWRTMRGEWFSKEEIDELWEDPDGVEPGWFETSVEADDVPNVWRTNPTHWQPLPAAPLPQGE